MNIELHAPAALPLKKGEREPTYVCVCMFTDRQDSFSKSSKLYFTALPPSSRDTTGSAAVYDSQQCVSAAGLKY